MPSTQYIRRPASSYASCIWCATACASCVSTNDQNTDLQRNALVCAGCEQIFEDKLSGIRTGRPGLKRALKRLQKGDALVVWKLD
ncbi:EAST1 family heat-stable enterotoxin [Escherichia coli]|uniref:EAST1 family heat-stable enterotoxin n=1 Tax=Escherichia coli TaxID=562 RepID=UPI00388E9B9A